MRIFIQVAIAVLAIWSALWSIRKMLKREAWKGAGPKSAGDPFARVPAPRRPNPKGRAGAVALREPENDEPAHAYPPRTM